MTLSFSIAALIGAGLGLAQPSAQISTRTQATLSNGNGQVSPEATPPVIVNFQGHLRQGTAIVNGTYNMTFRIYSTATGGTALQTINLSNVGVSSGVFNVQLPITQSIILNNTDLWVEVEIAALGGVYSPRVKINSAAFAYNAFMADTAQRVQDNSINLYDIAGFNEAATSHTDLFDWDMNDNGRIDQDLLEVYGSGTDPGYIWNQDTVMQTPGRFWIADSGVIGDPTSNRYAVLRMNNNGLYGITDNTTGAGVFGFGVGTFGVYGATNTDFSLAGAAGVYGYASYDNGLGVYGVGAGSGGVGVLGAGNGAAGSYYLGTGVVGISDQIGTYGYGFYGLWGHGADATEGVGVIAEGNDGSAYTPPTGQGTGLAATGGNYAAFGIATLAQGTGAYFNGNNLTTRYGFSGINAAYEGAGTLFGAIFSATDDQGVGLFSIGSRNTISNFIYTGNTGVCGLGEDQGVYGRPDVAFGDANEVEGYLGLSGNAWGLWVGVYGYESDSNDPSNSHAWVDDGSLAGYFNGDVWVVDDIVAQDFFTHAKGAKGDMIASAPKTVYNDAMISGTTHLSNGEVSVKLDPDFLNMIDPSSMRVIATPVGAPVNVYVSEINSDGFVLKSVDGQDCRVDWMVTAYQFGAQPKIDQSNASAVSVVRPKLSSTTSEESSINLNTKGQTEKVKVHKNDSETEVK